MIGFSFLAAHAIMHTSQSESPMILLMSTLESMCKIRAQKEKGSCIWVSVYQEYLWVLKHLSVRWLSLEICVSTVILKYKSLKSYFLSQHFADDRFKGLNEKFLSPLLEPVMLFHSAAVSLFKHFSLLVHVQRGEPTIHILKYAMKNLDKTLPKWIIIPEKLRDISSSSYTDLESPDNFKDIVCCNGYKEHPDKTAEWSWHNKTAA